MIIYPFQRRTSRLFARPQRQRRICKKILHDLEFRRSFRANLKTYNPLIVVLYRSGLLPLFGLSRTVMLLITRGKKSGKLRSTPVGYFKIGGVIHLFSGWGKDSAWYKNMTANPNQLWIQVGLRKRSVVAQVLENHTEIRRTLEQFVSESPLQAGTLFGWDAGRDQLEQADFYVLIRQVCIVRFVEKPKPGLSS